MRTSVAIIAAVGPIAQSCLLAYAAEQDAVHLMFVSSMGEVHDHHGKYASGTVRFEPLEGYVSGAPVVETVQYGIGTDGALGTTSVVLQKGKSDSRFEFTAKRWEKGE